MQTPNLYSVMGFNDLIQITVCHIDPTEENVKFDEVILYLLLKGNQPL